jgi:alkanesulfonate monooxygenase SsuD/methylene tetrahydromethanopterin reductase-like flavin-dependent oxidoreductase (luciferase family)
MTLQCGVFDHIDPVPGLRLDQIYRERRLQVERFDAAGFPADHVAEHHYSKQKSRPHPNRIGGVALAGSPSAVREYMEGYVAIGANYFVCSLQSGDLTHEQAMRSIELLAREVMPRYAPAVSSTRSRLSNRG